MSQHRIVGSEAFGRRPHVYIRVLKPGAFHRRKGRLALAFAAGAAAAIAAGVATAAVMLAPARGL